LTELLDIIGSIIQCGHFKTDSLSQKHVCLSWSTHTYTRETETLFFVSHTLLQFINID